MDDAVSLVVDPDTFFRKRRNDPGALVPALVLLGVGLVTVGVGLYRRGFMMSVAPEGGRTAAFSGFILISSFLSLVAPFVRWLILGGVILAVTHYVGGDNSPFDLGTLKLLGWGFLPSLIGAVVTSGVVIYVLSSSDPANTSEAIQTLTSVFETLRSTPMEALSYSLVLWQGSLWTFAVKNRCNLELRRAAVPAATAVAVIVAWKLFGLAVVSQVFGIL